MGPWVKSLGSFEDEFIWAEAINTHHVVRGAT